MTEGSRSSKELDVTEESRSSKDLDMTEGYINQQLKEKEDDDMKDPGEITEKKESREKANTANEEHKEPVNEEVPQKDGWMRRKLKKWRISENPPKEVSTSRVGQGRPEPKLQIQDKATHHQGEANIPRLPNSRGSAKTLDKGERENEDGVRRAQKDIGGSSNYTCKTDLGESHVIHNTKYGSEVL